MKLGSNNHMNAPLSKPSSKAFNTRLQELAQRSIESGAPLTQGDVDTAAKDFGVAAKDVRSGFLHALTAAQKAVDQGISANEGGGRNSASLRAMVGDGAQMFVGQKVASALSPVFKGTNFKGTSFDGVTSDAKAAAQNAAPAPDGSRTQFWVEVMADGDLATVVDDLSQVAKNPNANGEDLREVASFICAHGDLVETHFGAVADVKQAVVDGVKRLGGELLSQAQSLEVDHQGAFKVDLTPADKVAFMGIQAEFQDMARASFDVGSSLTEVFAQKLESKPVGPRAQLHLDKVMKAIAKGVDPRLHVKSQADADALVDAYRQQSPSVDTTDMSIRTARLFRESVHKDIDFGTSFYEAANGVKHRVLRGHESGPKTFAKNAKALHGLEDSLLPHYQIEPPNGPSVHIFIDELAP